MGQLTSESLEFAKEHLQKYYSSDFYPDPIELEAIWFQWNEVKSKLMSVDIKDSYETHALTALPWRKHKGGYRIVHQLEITDCIVYIALAYLAANKIELNRKPVEAGVACAYRIQLSQSSFFANGNGFDRFKERSRDLSKSFQFVLTTDIVDFYNQIYLHRLQNAIASTGLSSAELATDIERFLSKLNLRNSQGVPVGPAASIVFSEATLTDVDDFLSDLDVEHTRYVDDFRIFSNDRVHLEKVHRELTLYLHKAHRLTLSGEKTRIQSTETFVKSELDNHYELEKAELFDSLDDVNEYIVASPADNEDDAENKDDTPDDECSAPLSDVALRMLTIEAEKEKHKNKVIEGFQGLCSRPTLDLGMARALLRQARLLKVAEIVDACFDNVELLRPVFNALAFYFREIAKKYGKEKFSEKLFQLSRSSNFSELEQIWLEWIVLSGGLYEEHAGLKSMLTKSQHFSHQAILAFNEKNLAWVRKYKDEIFALSPQGKRAVIYASRILPDDERSPWLKQLRRSATDITDTAIINWSLAWKEISDDFFDMDEYAPF